MAMQIEMTTAACRARAVSVPEQAVDAIVIGICCRLRTGDARRLANIADTFAGHLNSTTARNSIIAIRAQSISMPRHAAEPAFRRR